MHVQRALGDGYRQFVNKHPRIYKLGQSSFTIDLPWQFRRQLPKILVSYRIWFFSTLHSFRTPFGHRSSVYKYSCTEKKNTNSSNLKYLHSRLRWRLISIIVWTNNVRRISHDQNFWHTIKVVLRNYENSRIPWVLPLIYDLATCIHNVNK